MSVWSARNVQRRALALLGRLPWVSGPLTLLAAGFLLAFWWVNVSHLLDDTAPVVSLQRTEVRLAPGQTTVIGHRELLQGEGAGSGERAHLAFSHGAEGRVTVRNVARQKRLWLDYAEGVGTYAARWRLRAGDVIAATGFSLTVTEAAATRVRMTVRGGEGEMDLAIGIGGTGASVTLGGQTLPVCAAPDALDRLRAIVKGYLARDDRGEERVLDLGGRLTCQVSDTAFVAAPSLPFRAFSLVARGDGLFFGPGEAASGPRPPVQFRRSGAVFNDFADIPWELDPAGPEQLSHLIVGRTRYRVALTAAGRDQVVSLTPVSKLRRLSPAEAAEIMAEIDTPGVRVVPTAPRQPFSRAEMADPLAELNGAERLVRLSLMAGLLGLAVMGFFWRFSAARGWALLGAAPGALAALSLAGLAAGLALTPELSRALGLGLGYRQTIEATLLASGLASVLLALSPGFALSTRLVWLATLGLVALGNLTLTALAIDSPRTDFATHVHKNKLLFVDLVPVLATVIATLPAAMVAGWPRSFFAGGRALDGVGRLLPAALLVAGLLAWGLFGTETGVGGFQPVELGKIALVLLLAHVFAGFLRIDVFYGQRQYLLWLGGAVASALVFFLFLTAIPFLKSDYSPILIILMVTIALAFAFLAPGAIRRLGQIMAVLRRRRDAPQRRFALGLPRGAALAGVLLALLGLNVALMAAFPAMASKLIAGAWSIPSERLQALSLLEGARGGPLRVPAERLLTWYDLDHTRLAKNPPGTPRPPDVLHRDLGLQLLLSKLALAQTPCRMSRLVLPPLGPATDALAAVTGGRPEAALCPLFPDWPQQPVPDQAERLEDGAAVFSVRDLLRVPVIQNDFIATYVLVRFGLPVGLMVVLLQLLFVGGLLALAVALRWRPGVGFQDEAARTGLSIVAVGIATLFAVHWAISWGNAMGLLPVMGQPMTLIAAATSHHLLMALPAIALVLLAGRVQGLRARPLDRAPPRW